MRQESLPTKSSAGWADRLRVQLKQQPQEKTEKREDGLERPDTRIFKSRPLQNYTIVANSLAQSETLSLGAKGLMLYLLSLPDVWEITMPNVQKAVGVGRAALRTLFRELESHGHMYLSPAKRLQDGTLIGNRWYVYADPKDNPTPEVIRPPVGRIASVYKGNTDKEIPDKKGEERVSVPSLRSETTTEPFSTNDSNLQNNSGAPQAKKVVKSVFRKQDRPDVPPKTRYAPSKEDFDAYVAENCPLIENFEKGEFDKKEAVNWHRWNKRTQQWEPINWWKKYLDGLENRIETDRTKK